LTELGHAVNTPNRLNETMPDAELSMLASALLDGTPGADGIAVDALLAHDARGTALRSAWARHAQASDALRGTVPRGDYTPFLARLHSSLQNDRYGNPILEAENTPIFVANNPAPTPTNSQKTSQSQAPVGSVHGHAANDARWRLVAGLAGFAAVLGIAFGGWQAQRASNAHEQLAAVQSLPSGNLQAVRAALPRSSLGGEDLVWINGQPEVMLRDPQMLERLAQHRQLSSGVHSTHAGFFRASTVAPHGR
jgi:hypothetical protein